MREALWNNRLNSKLKIHLKECVKIQCLEHNGISDNYYLGERPLWMEAKMLPSLPVKDDTLVKPPKLKELQKMFLNHHYESPGSEAMVIVAIKQVPGYRGAVGIPYFTPSEWENGVPKNVAVQRLMTYGQIVDAIKNYCNSTDVSLEMAFKGVING